MTLWNVVSVCKLSDEEEKTLKEKWQSKLGPQNEVMVRLICILSCLADSYFLQLRFVSVSPHMSMFSMCFSVYLSMLICLYCIYIVLCMCAGGPGTEIHWERWSWCEFGGKGWPSLYLLYTARGSNGTDRNHTAWRRTDRGSLYIIIRREFPHIHVEYFTYFYPYKHYRIYIPGKK